MKDTTTGQVDWSRNLSLETDMFTRPAFQFRNFTFAVLAVLFVTLALYHLSDGQSRELEKIYPSYELWEPAGAGVGAMVLQTLFDLSAFIAVICCAVVLIGLRQLIYHNRKKHTARVFNLTLGFFTLVYLLGGNLIFRALTNNPEVIANARPYFFWVVMVPMVSYTAFLWDGIYIGATAGKEMRNAMLISTLVVFFPAYFLASKFIGNHGLWFAFILFMLARGITMQVLSKKAVYSKLSG